MPSRSKNNLAPFINDIGGKSTSTLILILQKLSPVPDGFSVM